MKTSELRKIINAAKGPDVEINFEHAGKTSAITGYTVERNVDGTTKAILLKTDAV